MATTIPLKQICYVYDGEKWTRHYTYVSNKRMCNYISQYNEQDINQETAMLGFAKLGIMKLGQGG